MVEASPGFTEVGAMVPTQDLLIHIRSQIQKLRPVLGIANAGRGNAAGAVQQIIVAGFDQVVLIKGPIKTGVAASALIRGGHGNRSQDFVLRVTVSLAGAKCVSM